MCWLGTHQAGHGGRGTLWVGALVCLSPHRQALADRVTRFASGALLLTTPARNSQQCRHPYPCAAVVVNLARKYRVQLPVLTAVAQVRRHVPVGLSQLGRAVAGQRAVGASSATVCALHWLEARRCCCAALRCGTCRRPSPLSARAPSRLPTSLHPSLLLPCQVVDGHITAEQAVFEIMNLPQIEER